MKIPLSQGFFATVDDEDFLKLNSYKWHVCKNHKTRYALRCIIIDGKNTTIAMHRAIFSTIPSGAIVDHIDGNGLNNQKSNLRIVTTRQNLQNQNNREKKRSKYPGVSWHSHAGKWNARITINGKTKSLGYFTSEDAAHEAYLSQQNLI